MSGSYFIAQTSKFLLINATAVTLGQSQGNVTQTHVFFVPNVKCLAQTVLTLEGKVFVAADADAADAAETTWKHKVTPDRGDLIICWVMKWWHLLGLIRSVLNSISWEKPRLQQQTLPLSISTPDTTSVYINTKHCLCLYQHQTLPLFISTPDTAPVYINTRHCLCLYQHQTLPLSIFCTCINVTLHPGNVVLHRHFQNYLSVYITKFYIFSGLDKGEFNLLPSLVVVLVIYASAEWEPGFIDYIVNHPHTAVQCTP